MVGNNFYADREFALACVTAGANIKFDKLLSRERKKRGKMLEEK